ISCPTNNNAVLYPICLGIKTITTINQRNFIITVVQDGFEPRYLYQSEALQSNICKSSSAAATSIYQQAFFMKTKLDSLLVMGFDDLEIYKSLLYDI
ncbi:14682_t:CDS:1, partial [Dentiscutata heterogama]